MDEGTSDPRATASAHRAWSERWSSDAGRVGWVEPEPDVIAVAANLRQHGAQRVLDLGCGVGRHALHLAAQGLTVSGLDASVTGVEVIQREAARRGLRLGLVIGTMTELPYESGRFDYVLSWNVIYHGNGEIVRRCIAEIHRVLRPHGLYQGTMLSKRHRSFGQGRQVARNTFVVEDDAEKAHPHFYCDAAELVELFSGFEVRLLIEREQGEPGSYHWHMTAEHHR